MNILRVCKSIVIVAIALGACLTTRAWAAADESAAGGPAAASWPEFHGPGRTNISPEKGLLAKWPEAGPPLIWKYTEAGQGYSGVSIAQNTIFTAGNLDKTETLIALSLDGKLLWKTGHGKAWRGPSPGARTTPTYNEGTLYHLTAAGRLGAFDATTGKEKWARDVKAEFDAPSSTWGFAENVIVDGDRVICMPGGTKGRVVALDKHTGKTLWVNTQIEHSAAYCSPTIVNYGGVRQWLSMTQKSVVSVDVETGKLIWSAPFVPTSPQNALTPVFHDGYVFVACGHSSGGSLMKVNLDTHDASVVWHRTDLDNCHGGALLLGNNLYGCGCRAGGKCFYCVDFLTGQTKKIEKDKAIIKDGLTCADGMIYCINHQGTAWLLKPNKQGFDIVSHFNLGKKPANSYLAHPVVCGGRLYLRCDNVLYAFDVRDKVN